MKKKVFILQLTGGPLIKGEKVIFTEGGLIHAVSAAVNLTKDYNISILCPNPPGQKEKREINYQGLKIISIGEASWIKFSQYGNLDFFLEIKNLINKTSPQILIGNNLLASFLISFFPQEIKKVGVIHHLYLTLKNTFQPTISIIKIFENLSFSFIKRLDAIATVNPLTKETLIKKGFLGDKIFFVGNGVDKTLFSFSPKKEKNNLIYIGRLAELKGVEGLIDAVSEVKKEIPGIVLHLVGHGPKQQFLEKKIKLLNLKNNVIFHGCLGRNEIKDLLKKSSIYLSASKFEGFDIPLTEAMACGCTPIVSDIYAHRFIFQNQDVGYLVKDKNEMVRRIFELLKDENKRLFFSQNGRKLVEEKWTWENVGKRYKSLLQSL